MLWFLMLPSGVPWPLRGTGRLFSSKILLSGGTTQYCSISQKVLKGAAARIMIYWLCLLVAGKSDGSDHDLKLGFAQIHGICWPYFLEFGIWFPMCFSLCTWHFGPPSFPAGTGSTFALVWPPSTQFVGKTRSWSVCTLDLDFRIPL